MNDNIQSEPSHSETKKHIINRKLNKRQRMFVEAYCGCPLEAATIAGYVGEQHSVRAQGNKLLSDPEIMEAIKDRSRYLNKMTNTIASKDDRMSFWTQIMDNEDVSYKEIKDANGIPIPAGNIPMNMRLKASELLGKSEGDFVERIDISGTVTVSDIMLESYSPEANAIPLEVIEAEYQILRDKRKAEKNKPEAIEYTSPTPTSLGDLI